MIFMNFKERQVKIGRTGTVQIKMKSHSNAKIPPVKNYV